MKNILESDVFNKKLIGGKKCVGRKLIIHIQHIQIHTHSINIDALHGEVFNSIEHIK